MDQNKALVLDIVDRMKMVIGVSKDVDLAEHLGGARSTLSVWKKRGSIPIAECIAMARDKGISLDWLILGRGEREIGAGEKGGDDSGQYVDLPLFDMATASTDPRLAAWWSMPRAWLENESLPAEDAAILRVAGDSHAGGIEEGQMVLIDRRQRPQDGVYLVLFGGALRIKRVQHMVDGSMRLTSDNEAYAADLVSVDESASVEIIGHCHSAFRRVR